MKLNPLPWIEKWLTEKPKPSKQERIKELSNELIKDYHCQTEEPDGLLMMYREKNKRLELKEAVTLAELLYGDKS